MLFRMEISDHLNDIRLYPFNYRFSRCIEYNMKTKKYQAIKVEKMLYYFYRNHLIYRISFSDNGTYGK